MSDETTRTLPNGASGAVALVGAGPGAADLLTVRAARLLAQADVVVYDNLVGDDVLGLVRADAQRIYAGKQAGRHTLPQGEINALLVRLARAGKKVVRLKGGDPFIFGRGGEELAELMEAGIACQVVPGVTAASGAAAFAGIPLTHREHAQACMFVTGHLKEGACPLDWSDLVRERQTLVIYMGLNALREISAQLIAAGMRADMPAACIENATLSSQRTVRASLRDLPGAVAAAGIGSPALLIIGTVVTLQSKLAWFE